MYVENVRISSHGALARGALGVSLPFGFWAENIGGRLQNHPGRWTMMGHFLMSGAVSLVSHLPSRIAIHTTRILLKRWISASGGSWGSFLGSHLPSGIAIPTTRILLK